MISQKTLKRAISAAALLRYFPANDCDARAALGEVLVEICPDDDSLELARGICLSLSEWPGLAHFRECVLNAINAHKFAQLPLPCEKCEQMDFVLVERNGQVLTDRCSCARGRRLLAWKPREVSQLES